MQEISRRHRQVANAIREELVTILRKDISDPRLDAAGMITISGVEVHEDMRNATVWVSFMGKAENAKEVKEALAALKSAGAFIHRLLIKRISMKVHPRLLFRFDNMFDRAAVISTALHEAEAVEKETARVRSTQPPEEAPESSETPENPDEPEEK